MIESSTFRTVTGRDFGRAIQHARKRGNPVSEQIKQAVAGHSYDAFIDGGSLDGMIQIVVAWVSDAVELARLNAGAPVYLTVLGPLPAHMLSTDFQTATHPA